MWGGRKTKRMRVDDRHERALDIGDGCVQAAGASRWRVRGGAEYTVVQHAEQCPQRSCREWDKCFASGCRGLCAHMFQCSCPDENPLCKHIHKVRMLSVRAALTPAQQAVASRDDQRWRRQVNVGRQLREARGHLKDIGYSLDRYDEDALAGVIDEVTEALGNIAAKLSCHCDDFENGEDGDDGDSDDDEDDEADEDDEDDE